MHVPVHQNNLDDIKVLARNIMDTYGLSEWDFKFCNGKQLHGKANLTQKIISISKIHAQYEQNNKAIKDTILHEIAHALDYNTRGFSNHDVQWKKIARMIGCVPSSRGYGISTLPFSSKELCKFIGTCPNCSKIYYRNRRKKVACGICCKKYSHGRYSKKYELIYHDNKDFIKL
jgi:predicted SprT family Zn-dependent metalloprotease